jgi:hypothetical protein
LVVYLAIVLDIIQVTILGISNVAILWVPNQMTGLIDVV